MNFDINLIRFGFSLLLIMASVYLSPFPQKPFLSGFIGLFLATAIIFFEVRIRKASLKTLIGGAFGSILGIIGASLIGFLVSVQDAIPPHIKAYATLLLMLFMAYVGLIVGAIKGDYINLSIFGGLLRSDSTAKTQNLILDTSVIIDGRVADIAETGFLGGQLIIPQFMLRELQQVADSADSAKRNRGRRGLDILQRIQKNHNLDVSVSDVDFPDIREVDHKLIELAKQINGKIVTNDFNLNKVAQLRGVQVLNINELANALKPVVLPGETMKVFILKEGKEYNQGVAYLDDGTMVVVDNARRMINKNIEISVTSVLQTTAGKMIFGKYMDERSNPPNAPSTPTGVSVSQPTSQTSPQPASATSSKQSLV
ncbi:MAG: PIN domain nuclease [Blastocatellia bacterium]|nr:PIN domain nuclease [Blastocatellia bacterium]